MNSSRYMLCCDYAVNSPKTTPVRRDHAPRPDHQTVQAEKGQQAKVGEEKELARAPHQQRRFRELFRKTGHTMTFANGIIPFFRCGRARGRWAIDPG